MATVVTEARIAQRKEPLFTQFDLRYIREAAARTRRLIKLAEGMGRRLSRAELQLLMVCSAVREIVRGELGEVVEDGMTESIGDLVLREVPGLAVCHQPQLRPTEDNGARSI